MTIDVCGDNNGDVGTDEADLLDNCVPLNIVKRSGLEFGHDPHKRFPTFYPAASEVDVICIRYRRLRIGDLLSVMMTPGCVQVGEALPNCLFVTQTGLLG
nr:hypothetical protein [Granulicella sibirica]